MMVRFRTAGLECLDQFWFEPLPVSL